MRLSLGILVLTTSAVLFAAPATGRYKVVLDKLKALQTTHESFSRLVSLGTNDDGVEIVGIRVSTTPDVVDPKKIGHFVVSTHHGNELKAPDFTLHFTEELLKKFHGRDLFDRALVDTEWLIIPVLNIPGYNSANRNEKGRDPNRDYPGPCFSSPGGYLASIRVAMNELKKRSYTGSLTVHGYVGALTYPWGVSTTNTHTNDHNAFESATRKAAEINGYRYGTSTDIVYPVDGAFEDYAYWKHGAWSLLLELRDGSPSDIARTSDAVFTYFGELNSSPSVQNTMTGVCSRAGALDLHNE